MISTMHCRCRRRQADRAAWAIPGVDGGAVDARALPESGETAKRVRGRLLAWRAAPGTTLETTLHPILHHRGFVRCKRSLVRWNRLASVIIIDEKPPNYLKSPQ